MAGSSLDVARAFVQRINERNVAALRALMTEDHTFTDALGRRMIGAVTMGMGWKHFFEIFPEYWIRVETEIADGARVALFGEAGGQWKVEGQVLPGKRWKVRAAWLAEIEGGKVKTWKVYCDTGWAKPPEGAKPAS
ncbi:MAG: nuclear transport factor 2 family protein [Acidobacteriota bacterium]